MQIYELTNYQQWQQNKYGNILPDLVIMPDGSCENNEAELRRAEEWFNAQSETLIQDYYEY